MTSAAWIMMLTTMSIIAGFAFYFFRKVLTTPHRSESDEK